MNIKKLMMAGLVAANLVGATVQAGTFNFIGAGSDFAGTPTSFIMTEQGGTGIIATVANPSVNSTFSNLADSLTGIDFGITDLIADFDLHSFTVSFNADVILTNYSTGLSGLGSENIFFDVTGTGVSSTNNSAIDFQTDTAFAGSSLLLSSGELYTFNTNVANGGGSGNIAVFKNLTASAAPVPIPAAVWFLFSGVAGLIGIRRKQRT